MNYQEAYQKLGEIFHIEDIRTRPGSKNNYNDKCSLLVYTEIEPVEDALTSVDPEWGCITVATDTTITVTITVLGVSRSSTAGIKQVPDGFKGAHPAETAWPKAFKRAARGHNVYRRLWDPKNVVNVVVDKGRVDWNASGITEQEAIKRILGLSQSPSRQPASSQQSSSSNGARLSEKQLGLLKSWKIDQEILDHPNLSAQNLKDEQYGGKGWISSLKNIESASGKNAFLREKLGMPSQSSATSGMFDLDDEDE